MSYIASVRAGWKKIQVEPGTQNKKLLRALDYIATPFRPSGTYLADLRLRPWQKQCTRFDNILWKQTEVPGLFHGYNVDGQIDPKNIAFYFDDNLLDFKNFPVPQNDSCDPTGKVITKMISFAGFDVGLEFSIVKVKKQVVGRSGVEHYQPNTEVRLKTFDRVKGETLLASGPLKQFGIYRFEMNGEDIYFGEAAQLKRLLIDDRKRPEIYYVPNENRVKTGSNFKLVVVDGQNNVFYVDQDNTMLRVGVNGKYYIFTFDRLFVGRDLSSKEQARIFFPSYQFRILDESTNKEIKLTQLTMNIIRIQLEGQNVFIFAQPL